MLPYWILFSVFALGSLEYRRRGLIGSQATPFLWVAAIGITLMIGVRFEVGGDWRTYQNLFDQYYSYAGFGQSIATGDPGYSLLNWIAHRLGFGVWFVNLVCGAIFTWGLVRFAKRQPNPWLVILVGIPYLVIVVAMGYTRQGVAIGFVLAGLAMVDRSSILRFSIYMLLAMTFHKSAIVVLPLVALAASQRRITTAILLFALMAYLYYVFVASSVDHLMTVYVDAAYASQGAAIRIAMNVPPALLFLLFQRRFGLDPQQKQLWRNFSLAAIGCGFIFYYLESSTVVDRLALYLIPLQLFVLSRLPEVFPDRRRANMQLVLAVMIYSAAIQFTWLNYATHARYWVPYRTVIQADQL